MLENHKTRRIEPPRKSDSAERNSAERFLAKAAAHRVAGRFDKAHRNLRSALEAAPNHAGAHFELGLLTYKTAAPGPAVPHFVAAVRAAPERPVYWLALATTLLDADRPSDARALMERFRAQGLREDEAQAAMKSFIDRVYADGRARYDSGDLSAAEALFETVIAFDDTHADATYYAGAVAAKTNRLQLAFDLFSIAIYRDPDNAAYYCTLGVLLSTMEDLAGAVSALEKAIVLNPDLALAHSNLAGVLQRRDQYGQALAHARQAIALDPSYSGAYLNLGSSLKCLGQIPEAIAAYDQALALDPRNVSAHSNRLFIKLYASDVTPEAYFADAQAFGRNFAEHLMRRLPFANDRDPDRRLRIGFVSGDLYGHAVARFLEPVISHIDRAQFALHAYAARATQDAMTQRLQTLFDGWRVIAGLDDDETARLIEADAIDILVDLSGHTAGNRLLVFARKPAPIQATWMGHPASTGLTAIDYRITDDVHDPLGSTDALHTEALWRLPRVSATYRAPDDIPEIRERLPFDDNGYVTFGLLNRFEKVGDGALETWARILREVPDARLFMVVGDVDKPEIRHEVERRLSGAGLPLERIRLQPRVSRDHFALYHEVDIALDPFPYNGGTTSCETLCMGVPFVALRGAQATARTGTVVLSAVGLEELAGETPDDYARIGIALARDPDRLRAIRSGLRERTYASPLMDHARLGRHVGEAFRAMWRRWLDGTER